MIMFNGDRQHILLIHSRIIVKREKKEESFHVRLKILTANPMGKRKKERKEKKSLPDDKYCIMLYSSQINEFCT